MAAWVVAVVVGGVDVVPLLPHADSAGTLTMSIPVVRTSENIRIFMIVTVGTLTRTVNDDCRIASRTLTSTRHHRPPRSPVGTGARTHVKILIFAAPTLFGQRGRAPSSDLGRLACGTMTMRGARWLLVGVLLAVIAAAPATCCPGASVLRVAVGSTLPQQHLLHLGHRARSARREFRPIPVRRHAADGRQRSRLRVRPAPLLRRRRLPTRDRRSRRPPRRPRRRRRTAPPVLTPARSPASGGTCAPAARCACCPSIRGRRTTCT